MQQRSISILGASGSIGKSTASLIELHRDAFDVQAITAHRNIEVLAAQARALRCKAVAIGEASLYKDMQDALFGTGIHVTAGEQAVIEAAAMPADIVVASIVGAAGLAPTLAAIKQGKTVALANKECLVCAGGLVMQEVAKHNTILVPVDSEHSAIFQIFDFDAPETVEKITITASGGPFREFSLEEIRRATPEQALKHPVWNMGAKISIDSATMMNKGLEVIEAWHLFPVKTTQIEILVHPESIIHGMVSYVDGSVLSQMGNPDMSTPIAYALAWPARMQSHSRKLDLAAIGKLSFYRPDEERFPALRISRQAMLEGKSAPTALNAANEIAVERFLKKEVAFCDIISIIKHTLEKVPLMELNDIQDVMHIDNVSRKVARDYAI